MKQVVAWILLLAAPAAAQEEVQVFLETDEALRIALPGADLVVARDVELDTDTAAAVERRLLRKDFERKFRLYIGLKKGAISGYAVVTEEVGKYLPITFIVGIDPAGRVSDVAVMIHREKIGAECARRRYLNQLPGKGPDDPIRRNRDLVHVSGATMSCDGVARGVRKVLALVGEFCIANPERAARLVQDSARPVTQDRFLMGTLCGITAFGAQAKTLNAAFDEIKRWDAILSDYREDSELSKLNAKGSIEASADFLAFLEECRTWHAATGGVFDPTVGPLMRLWGFRGGAAAEPSPEKLKATLESVGWPHVRIEKDRVSFARPGMLLDPGGLGKGWALDQAARVLRKEGVGSALLTFGSTIVALGTPPGESGWDVAIRDPFDSKKTIGRVRLKDEAMSTSGSYEKFVEIGGKRLAHLIDPRTGRPAQGSSSATALARTGTETEALTKPLFILGPLEGLRFAEKVGRDALIVSSSPEAPRASTSGWRKRFTEDR
jgi:thiamine biosynthesis lipoprotein